MARDQMANQEQQKFKLMHKMKEELIGQQLKQIEDKKRNVIAQAKRGGSTANESEFQGLTTDFKGFPMLSKMPATL